VSRRTGLLTFGMLGLALTVAACANLPTSGNVNVNSLHGAGGPGAIGSQVVPRAPVKGWRPVDIVSGFLTASASYATDPTHKIAKEYLTQGKQGLAHRWRPGWAATIVDSPTFTPATSGLGSREQGGPQATSVVVTGKHLASLVTAGRYQAGSEVVQPTSTNYRFVLVQVGREWRISNIYVGSRPAPPSLLLLTRPDFDREYQSRNLYFYPAGPPRNTLVPDPVFIPAQVGDQGIAGLVQTLINPRLNNVNGPAGKLGSSWLFGAAQSAFPPRTKLLSAHLVGGITAVVNLGGAAAKTSWEQRQRMAAQLYLSLTYDPYPTQTANPVQSVVLKVNGRTFPQPSRGYASWVPRSPSGQLYYQVPEGPVGPAVAALHPDPPRIGQFPLPTALAGNTFSQMAVSTAHAGSAVVAGCRGHFVYLMPQSHAGHVITLPRLMDVCVSLSWDERGNLWIATKSQVYVVPAVGSEPPAKPDVAGVLGPNLVKTDIESLRVAPDGVRVAMLLKSKLGARIRIAAISKNSGPRYTYLAQTSQMLRVGTDVPDPIALTWLDSDHLLVLSKISQTKTQLFEVPLNGTQSTPVATPPGTGSVSVSRPKKLSEPIVVVAIPPTKTSPGRIETANNGLLNPDWLQAAKGLTPVFPG
jgi:Lipoprotein LpqB beta-propeller domain/Sporulation and spore germination